MVAAHLRSIINNTNTVLVQLLAATRLLWTSTAPALELVLSLLLLHLMLTNALFPLVVGALLPWTFAPLATTLPSPKPPLMLKLTLKTQTHPMNFNEYAPQAAVIEATTTTGP